MPAGRIYDGAAVVKGMSKTGIVVVFSVLVGHVGYDAGGNDDIEHHLLKLRSGLSPFALP